jgi:hypothetical protein
VTPDQRIRDTVFLDYSVHLVCVTDMISYSEFQIYPDFFVIIHQPVSILFTTRIYEGRDKTEVKWIRCGAFLTDHK